MGAGQKNGAPTSQLHLPRIWPQQQLAGGRMKNADVLLLGEKTIHWEPGEMEPCVPYCSNLSGLYLAELGGWKKGTVLFQLP